MNNSFISKLINRNTETKNKPSYLSNDTDDIFARYSKLEALYENNGAYKNVMRTVDIEGKWIEAIKPLRSCVNRSVEFYVKHILSGATVGSDNDDVLEAIKLVNKWSNFDANKRIYSKSISLLGDLFIKVLPNDKMNKILQEEISAKDVTSFKVDKRGILTEIRIDVSIEDGKTRTEYWTLDGDGYVSIWEHKFGKNANLANLGNPKEFMFLSEFGIDFIPIVYVGFIDFSKRGQGCTAHALDKIDEANRIATRLHQLLFRFNKPYFGVMANSVDAQNRPIPAPRLSTKDSSKTDKKTDETVFGDDSVFYLPGMSQMKSMDTGINYGDALSILNAMMDEIELDLPELKSYSMDVSQLSTKSIQLILSGAITRAKDARSNMIQGLIRLNQMSLTLGQFYNIFPATLGNYANGDFEHNIICDEIYGMDAKDKADLVKAFADTGMPLASAMRMAGYSQDEIDKVIAEKSNEDLTQNTNLANSLLAFNRQ